MKKLITIFLLIFSVSFANDQKIGLALAGGGAKGFAHVGVLKVIEEEKIPIDYIAGTSMGSIIGALYAMGYTASELEEIVLSHEWMKYFDESIAREETPIDRKFYDDRYLVTLPIQDYKIKLPQGAVKGQYIETLLNELFIDAQHIDDFSELPTEFICVATDIETGEKVLLKSGDLAKSVRASMAIPSAFTPVEIDGKLLLDGMLVSNFPAEVVKDMGADIVIGSDLVVNLRKKDELYSLVEILDQTTNYAMIREAKEKAEIVDVSIIPDLTGYTTADFDKAKALIDLGEKAAWAKVGELRKLRDVKRFEERSAERLPKIEGAHIRKINIKGNKKYSDEVIKNMISLQTPVTLKKEEISQVINDLYSLGYFEKVEYSLERNILEINVKETLDYEIKLGFNYNTYDYGELYFNLNRKGAGTFANEMNLDTVLGKDEYAKFRSRRYIGKVNKLVFEFTTEYKRFNEYELYQGNKKIGEVDVKQANMGVALGTNFVTNNSLFTGIRRNFHSGNNLIRSNLISIDNISFYFNEYYIEYLHDSLDDKYFPQKGRFVNLDISRSDPNISSYEFTKYSLDSKKNIPMGEKLVLNLGLNIDMLTYKTLPPTITPSLGGFQNRKDSIEFWGLTTSQYFSNKIGVISSDFSYEFSDSAYLTFRYNLAAYDDIGKYETIEGFGLGLGLKTVIGPVNFIIADNEDNETIVYFNLGYYF